MRRLQRWLAGLWILAFGFGVAPAHAQESSPELERLAQAVASHPEDPDLLFALAQRLTAHARDADAVEQLRTLTARWPAHRPEAWLLLGRLLYELGRAEEAVPPLERAVRARPGIRALRTSSSASRCRRAAAATRPSRSSSSPPARPPS